MSNQFTVEIFNPEVTSWERWVKRLETAFKVFNTQEEVKLHYLLHYMGTTTYNVLCDKLAPEDPEKKPYNEMVQLLEAYYSPKPLEIAEIYRFQSRRQLQGESVQEFCQELHRLSINCNFGTYLTKAIRNQFVFGLQSKRAQTRLMETKDLELKTAVEVAISMEISERDVRQLGDNINTVKDIQKCSSKSKNKHVSQAPQNEQKGNTIVCFRCGKNHLATSCTLSRDIKCRGCGGTGHLQRVCMKKKSSKVNQIELTEQILHIKAEDTQLRQKYFLKLQIEGKDIIFEVDSGAAVSLMSKNLFCSLFPAHAISSTKINLITYCQTALNVVGYASVQVYYKNSKYLLNLYITEINEQPLLGREWLRQLNLFEFDTIQKVNCTDKLDQMLKEYSNIFNGEVTKITGLQAKLKFKMNVKPVFIKSRRVPFKLRPLVEKEIDRLVEIGILESVPSAEWATPVVPVLKPNGTVRLCGDFKVTVNPNLEIDEHPLPTIEELFANMAGGVKFSKIDLQNAYLQLELTPEDRDYITLNTHKGLYRCNRLLYGIASAPAIWQRMMETVLQGIPGVSIFLDDIKITGCSDIEHLERLEKVFQQLHKYNIKVNLGKSQFFQDKIEYCGYMIDKQGIHKTKDKIEAMSKMPKPTNLTELRAFIGMINYYGRFIQNLAEILFPLHQLLRKGQKFIWTKACDRSFQYVKEKFQSDDFLVHFDPKLPLVLATDASHYGVGAVLSHLYPNGEERVIQYASHTLSETQKKYSQIDKEAYGIIFGVKKFIQYLYGNKFILHTDHRPLVQIFSPTKGLPMYSCLRMQHYALFLQGFNYDIRYKNTKEHGNADCLSRLPLKSKIEPNFDVVDVFHLENINTLPVNSKDLIHFTEKDPELYKIVSFLRKGDQIPEKDRFHIDQLEFNLEQGVLMREHRAVIPKQLRSRVLEELHCGHFGVVKMKGLARGYCWWPRIDEDIERLARNCEICNLHKNNPPKVENHIWEPSNTPFERVHADFAGPFMNKYFFILIDSFTKFPFVYIVDNMSSSSTIKVCREIFSCFGLPRLLVTDNGPTFTSMDFQNFLKTNGIVSKFTAPYHPQTNGQAERFVQTLKQSLLKMDHNSKNLNLQQLLFQYRTMPHTTTNKTPSELMFGRTVRSRLSLILPDKLKRNSIPYNDNITVREFTKGERVQVRNYTSKNKWDFGTIRNRLGKLHYNIELDDGRVWRRHADQIIASSTKKYEQDLEYDPIQNTSAADDRAPTSPMQLAVKAEEHREAQMENRPRRMTKLPSKFKDFVM